MAAALVHPALAQPQTSAAPAAGDGNVAAPTTAGGDSPAPATSDGTPAAPASKDAPAASKGKPAASNGTPQSLAAISDQIKQADAELSVLSRSARAPNLSDADIQAYLAAVPPIQAKLSAALAILAPRLADVETRLTQLGPAPSKTQPPEAPDIASKRGSLSHFHDQVDAADKQTKLLQVEATQLSERLTARQRQQLAARLWAQSRSIVDPGLWREFAAALPADFGRLKTLLAGEEDATADALRSPVTLATLAIALLVALGIAFPLRAMLIHLAHRRVDHMLPSTPLRRDVLALWLVAVSAFTPLLALVILHTALTGAGAISPAFEDLSRLIIRVVVFACLFAGLGRALLAPDRPNWRLAPIPNEVVSRLAPYPLFIGAAAGLAALVRGLNNVLGASPPTTIASDGITVMIELIAVGGALIALVRARSERLSVDVDTTSHKQAASRLPWVLAALLAWLTLIVSLGAVLTGYLELASKLMGEMIWVATVLAALFLLLRLVDDIFPAILSPDGAPGRFLRVAIGVSSGALEQMAVLLSGLARVVLLLFAWVTILAPFGVGAGDLFGRVTSTDLVIHMGHVSIAPGAVVGSIIVFLIGLFITRAVRGWVEKSYLPKTHLDVGLQTSVASGVTYLGALVALLITFGYLGLSFDKIALFASALSVGIGFGLQSVIGNFVSGLILLAERPVKVGDWIAIGDLEGDIRKINVRATEIEMGDKSKLIVPNSDLISKTVRNVTRGDSQGRVMLVLKVDDSADPSAVRDLLANILAQHAEILKDPAPGIYLVDVKDGALEFNAFAYVSTPRNAFRVKSELLFQIVPELKAKGITLAGSVPAANVGLGDRLPQPKPEEDNEQAPSS